ncbi:rCG48699 [Rattus norvegicus]|uniref:RCG48699 n=1 Tax=Rattus norvegicus TaxID=10116 RepID=A6IFW6_RAT|nr:rCG48699 [Rattus norvegicus]
MSLLWVDFRFQYLIKAVRKRRSHYRGGSIPL